MSDQATPAETGAETAAVDTPPVGTDQQPQDTQHTQDQAAVDWQKRYTDLQAEFTRTRQQLSDPEYRAQFAQEWLSANGYALPDDDPDPGEFYEEDPNALLAQRLEALEAQLAGQAQEQQEAAQIAELERVAESRLDELGARDEAARNWIVSRAIAMPAGPDGHLDIEAAHQEFQQLLEAQQQQWMQSKQRAPYVPPGGRAATEAPDLGSHEGRVNNMLRLLHERGDQQ